MVSICQKGKIVKNTYNIPNKDILGVINKYLFDKNIISKDVYEKTIAEIERF